MATKISKLFDMFTMFMKKSNTILASNVCSFNHAKVIGGKGSTSCVSCSV